MPDTTIPDALAADLRDFYLSAQPAGLALPTASVRFRHETTDLPAERLVILPGDPKFQMRQETTAMVPISLEYITPMDRVTPARHRETAGKLDTWLRTIRGLKRRTAIATRVYLHEIDVMQPVDSIGEEDREQITTLRAEVMVTLCTVTTV